MSLQVAMLVNTFPNNACQIVYLQIYDEIKMLQMVGPLSRCHCFITVLLYAAGDTELFRKVDLITKRRGISFLVQNAPSMNYLS